MEKPWENQDEWDLYYKPYQFDVQPSCSLRQGVICPDCGCI